MVTKKIKYNFRFFIYLFILLTNLSCALSQQQSLIAQQYEQKKKREQKQLQNTYYVKMVCPSNAEKYVENRYLDFPYSVPISAGQRVEFLIYYPETGVKYGGELEGMAEDREGFGKYPGYELCINDSIFREADSGGRIVFYLTTPKGLPMVKVTVWRSR
jgi:hypothetical protein